MANWQIAGDQEARDSHRPKMQMGSSPNATIPIWEIRQKQGQNNGDTNEITRKLVKSQGLQARNIISKIIRKGYNKTQEKRQ